MYDGAGETVPDAILEIWQPDADGKIVQKTGSLVRDGYTFTGWGRGSVGNSGVFTFTTVNPGPTEAGAAPFISVAIFARGLTNRLFTRIYLPENEEALANGPAAQLPGPGAPQNPDRPPRSRRRTDLGHPPAG